MERIVQVARITETMQMLQVMCIQIPEMTEVMMTVLMIPQVMTIVPMIMDLMTMGIMMVVIAMIIPMMIQSTRECLKKHSRSLHASLCGIFCTNSVVVAGYDALIRTKSPTNCDAHLAESLFQTCSSGQIKTGMFVS